MHEDSRSRCLSRNGNKLNYAWKRDSWKLKELSAYMEKQVCLRDVVHINEQECASRLTFFVKLYGPSPDPRAVLRVSVCPVYSVLIVTNAMGHAIQ